MISQPLPVGVAGEHMRDAMLAGPQQHHRIVRSVRRPGAIARPDRQAGTIPENRAWLLVSQTT